MIKRLDEFLASPKGQTLGLTNKSELLRHAINVFLDEQEDFYNKVKSIKDFVLTMKDRDHIILTYNTESELAEILSAFIDRGIKNNQINALYVTESQKRTFCEIIKKLDVNVDKMLNSQDLMTVLSEEYFQNKRFSFVSFENDLKFLVDLVKKRKKNGLFSIGLFGQNLVEQNRYDEAIDLEQKYDEFLKRSDVPITSICLYKTLPEKFESLIKSHDVIIKKAVTATGLQ